MYWLKGPSSSPISWWMRLSKLLLITGNAFFFKDTGIHFNRHISKIQLKNFKTLFGIFIQQSLKICYYNSTLLIINTYLLVIYNNVTGHRIYMPDLFCAHVVFPSVNIWLSHILFFLVSSVLTNLASSVLSIPDSKWPQRPIVSSCYCLAQKKQCR